MHLAAEVWPAAVGKSYAWLQLQSHTVFQPQGLQVWVMLKRLQVHGDEWHLQVLPVLWTWNTSHVEPEFAS